MKRRGVIKAARPTRRSVEAAEKRVGDNDEYFIRRGSQGWFRPDAHGYTEDIGQAGKFLGKTAKGFLNAEGVMLVPVTTMLKEIWGEVRVALDRAAKLSAMISDYRIEDFR